MYVHCLILRPADIVVYRPSDAAALQWADVMVINQTGFEVDKLKQVRRQGGKEVTVQLGDLTMAVQSKLGHGAFASVYQVCTSSPGSPCTFHLCCILALSERQGRCALYVFAVQRLWVLFSADCKLNTPSLRLLSSSLLVCAGCSPAESQQEVCFFQRLSGLEGPIAALSLGVLHLQSAAGPPSTCQPQPLPDCRRAVSHAQT